jgi:hypothetical protein
MRSAPEELEAHPRTPSPTAGGRQRRQGQPRRQPRGQALERRPLLPLSRPTCLLNTGREKPSRNAHSTAAQLPTGQPQTRLSRTFRWSGAAPESNRDQAAEQFAGGTSPSHTNRTAAGRLRRRDAPSRRAAPDEVPDLRELGGTREQQNLRPRRASAGMRPGCCPRVRTSLDRAPTRVGPPLPLRHTRYGRRHVVVHTQVATVAPR